MKYKCCSRDIRQNHSQLVSRLPKHLSLPTPVWKLNWSGPDLMHSRFDLAMVNGCSRLPNISKLEPLPSPMDEPCKSVIKQVVVMNKSTQRRVKGGHDSINYDILLTTVISLTSLKLLMKSTNSQLKSSSRIVLHTSRPFLSFCCPKFELK